MSNMMERLKQQAYRNKSVRNEVFSDLMEMQLALFFTSNCSIEQLKELKDNPDASFVFLSFIETDEFPFKGILEKMGFKLTYESYSETEMQDKAQKLVLALDRNPAWKNNKAMELLEKAIENREKFHAEAEMKRKKTLEKFWEKICQKLESGDGMKLEHNCIKEPKNSLDCYTLKATLFFTEIQDIYAMEFLSYYSWAIANQNYITEKAYEMGFNAVEWSCFEPCKVVLILHENHKKVYVTYTE